MKPKLPPIKPFLMLLYGYPGAGKTLFAKQFADELQNTIHLHGDKLQHDLGEGLRSKGQDVNALAPALIKFLTNEYLNNGISVILDVPITKKSERNFFRGIASKNKAQKLMVWLQIDSDSAYSRVKKRDRRKTEDKYSPEYTNGEFQSIISNSQNPENEDYVVISGKHTFLTQRGNVLKKLFELGVLSGDQSTQNIVKPGLVNLIPKGFNDGREMGRRNISIR